MGSNQANCNVFYGPNPASFCLFSFFSHGKYSTNTVYDKSIDCVLGTRTRGGWMVDADESTELWRNPKNYNVWTLSHWHRRLRWMGERSGALLVASPVLT